MDKPSEIVPYIEEPNHDQMSNHAYPPQFHDIQPEKPLEEVSDKIPINGIIGKVSSTAYCYNCNDYCETRVEKKVGSTICNYFCFLMILLPILSPVPFCISRCYDTGHYCPKCKKLIARLKSEVI